MDRDQCLQEHNELKKLDSNDTRKRIVKLMNTKVEGTAKIYYNFFEDFMGKLVGGNMFKKSIIQEWVKVLVIVIPQTITIAILIKLISLIIGKTP